MACLSTNFDLTGTTSPMYPQTFCLAPDLPSSSPWSYSALTRLSPIREKRRFNCGIRDATSARLFVLLWFTFQIYSYSHDFTVLLPPWSHFLIIFHSLDDVHLLATFPSDSGYGRQRWRCHGWTFLANIRAYFYQSEDYGIHRLRDD